MKKIHSQRFLSKDIIIAENSKVVPIMWDISSFYQFKIVSLKLNYEKFWNKLLKKWHKN
jgi:hypothetical protein